MAYKIAGIQGEPRTDDHGNVSAFVSLEGEPQGALLRKRPPFPQVGEELDPAYELKEIEKKDKSGTYLKLVKPNPNGGGGFGGGGMSPEREKKIVRQHSQHMALLYAQMRAQQGKLPDEFSPEDLFAIADKFDRDAGV